MADTFGVPDPPSGTVFAVGHAWRAVNAEDVRGSLAIIGALGFIVPLGGSRSDAVVESDWIDHPESEFAILDPLWTAGLTVTCDVWVKTESAGTSVTVRVINEDSTVVGTSDASTATDWTKVSFTLTLATGEKAHRLQIQGGNESAAIYACSAKIRVGL